MRRVETLLACMFLCCMIVCGEDVELKQDLGVKNQGEIATAKATVPGKMTSAEVKNYDGWNGWKGGIASENSAEFNATVPAGFSGVHKPSFGGWFANSNGGNGGSGNGGLKSWKLDATVRSYDIAIDSVEHADYIGDLADGQKVYCTSQKANDYVTIKLRTIPQNATLPEGVVKWEGGEQGENQLIRKVSKRNLIEGGLPINAKINGSDASIKIRVYVYRAKPNTKVDVTINKFRDDMACRSEARIKGRPIFGVAFIESCTDGISSNNVVFSYYYKDEEKKFIPIFKSLSYEIQWGVFDNGRTNINDGKERDPFPLGRGMVASISNKERRIIARNDFM